MPRVPAKERVKAKRRVKAKGRIKTDYNPTNYPKPRQTHLRGFFIVRQSAHALFKAIFITCIILNTFFMVNYLLSQ